MSNKFGDISYGYSIDEKILEKEYIEWLSYIVGLNNDSMKLANALYLKKFRSIIPNDINRFYDGMTLRDRFRDETLYDDYEPINKPCSILEMLIVLSERMAELIWDPDEDEDLTINCFYEILDNLGISGFNDENYERLGGDAKINHILDVFLERGYDEYGNGGLFPMDNPPCDQTKVEIWYQMSAYLMEKYMNV